MAKHAKPTLTTTLSRQGARGAAALTMASFGFLATAPAALAGGSDDGDYDHHKKHGDVTHHEANEIDKHESEGVVNVADNDVLVPVQVCDNYVPVNVLGVQVPIKEIEVAGALPILTHGDTEADSSDSCQQAAGIGDGHQAHSASAPPAPAAGSNDVAAGPEGAEQTGGGTGAGDVAGLVADNGAPTPAAEVSPAYAEPSTGDALGSVPQGIEAAPAPAGDLGMASTPQPAQSDGLAPGGL